MSTFQTRLHNYLYRRRSGNRNSGLHKNKRRSILLLIFLFLAIYTNTTVNTFFQALTPPNLPPLQVTDSKGNWLKQYRPDQNWGGTRYDASDATKKYHHISQGTRTLPIPYDWFIHLEQPNSSVWSFLLKSLFFIGGDRFADNRYLLRFGFIRSEPHPKYNPDGLPIGFARSPSLNIDGFSTRTQGIGFSCPACHTGHFVHGEGDAAMEYIIEGAPATTDLGQMTAALAAALGQTALSSKMPIFDSRFDRFARNVLGTQYTAAGKGRLADEIATIIESAQKVSDIVDVQEGFTRLDALNRIGNQVFANDTGIRENYHPIDAPVNYPHIWTTSWFKWVQYDGSIMRPLVRNVGEAMGVSAAVSMNTPSDENRFDSSIPIPQLVWLEDFLKGESFNEGLTAPQWPLQKVDKHSPPYKKGKALYQERCQSCHLPVIGDPALEKYISPIHYVHQGEPRSTGDSVLNLKIIPLRQIGTDPAQATVLVTRTISTAGNAQGSIIERTEGLGIDHDVCGQNPEQVYKNRFSGTNESVDLIDTYRIRDGGEINFGLALGAIVQQTIDAWFRQNGITDPALQSQLEGGRPNCLQEGQGYKARPLNGVWSTAPFLHNGSVATLKDLLCTAPDDRPRYVQLGSLEFDEQNIGIKQPENFQDQAGKYRADHKLYTSNGYFILDTTIPANRNSGHGFTAEWDPNKHYSKQKPGVIGPGFSESECEAILTYVKSL